MRDPLGRASAGVFVSHWLVLFVVPVLLHQDTCVELMLPRRAVGVANNTRKMATTGLPDRREHVCWA